MDYASRKMDTKLSIEQIQLAIYNTPFLVNKRSDIVCPNLSWSMLPYEADMVIINKSGFMTEIEIKRSYEDLKADFNKKHHHDDERVYYFYYCLPISIKDKAITFLKQKYEGKSFIDSPALLFYDENGSIVEQNFGWKENRCKGVKFRKLFIEEQLQIARLAQMRFWNLLNKINPITHEL